MAANKAADLVLLVVDEKGHGTRIEFLRDHGNQNLIQVVGYEDVVQCTACREQTRQVENAALPVMDAVRVIFGCIQLSVSLSARFRHVKAEPIFR